MSRQSLLKLIIVLKRPVTNVRSHLLLFHTTNIRFSLILIQLLFLVLGMCGRASWQAAFTTCHLAQCFHVSPSPAGCAVSAKTPELPASLLVLCSVISLFRSGRQKLKCIKHQLFCKGSSLVLHTLFDLYNVSMRNRCSLWNVGVTCEM